MLKLKTKTEFSIPTKRCIANAIVRLIIEVIHLPKQEKNWFGF